MYTIERLARIPFYKSLLERKTIDNILDALTCVVNRKYIYEYINYLIENKIPFSLGIVDLDDFKAVNDNYGHAKGDKLLEAFGESLLNNVDDNIVVGRFGGDEFLLVNTKDTNYDTLYAFFYGLYHNGSLRKFFHLKDLDLFVTGTVGGACYPIDATTFDELMLKVDKTLYRGKSKGRNCFIVYVEEKHKDIDILKLMKKSLYLIFSNISNILDSDSIIERKILNVINLVIKELGITGGMFISSNGNVIGNPKYNCSDIFDYDLSKILKKDGLYYCNDTKIIKKDSEQLYNFCVKNNVSSLLYTKVTYNDKTLGYLFFTESAIQRMWQDNDFALLLFITKILGQSGDSIYLLNHESFVLESDKVLDSRLFDGISMNSKNRYYFITNMETNNSHWSKNAVKDFKLPGEYINDVRNLWFQKIHPDDQEQYNVLLDDLFCGRRKTFNYDYRIKNYKDEYVYVTGTAYLMPGSKGHGELFIGTIENHSSIDYIDPITNLYNIYCFNENIQKLLDKNIKLSILGINLTHFSQINSIYGYSFGNKVLKEAGNIMYQMVKGQAILYKLDGVKFGVCFLNSDKKTISNLFNKIKDRLSKNLCIGDFQLSVGCSGGALIDCCGISAQEVYTSLAYALVTSKYEKNDELVYFDAELSGNNEKNLKIIKIIRNSVNDNCKDFYLDYQPVVKASTEEIIGAEALLRFKNEELGIVPPGIFIPWLENDVCFYELGLWILRKALTDMLDVTKKKEDFVLNVNVAYSQLANPNFVHDVINILKECNYPSKFLCLEITERCRHLDKQYLEYSVNLFRDYGIKIAIDDFGTGYSSLEVLNYIKSDTMKVDRSFIIDLQNNYINQSIIESISQVSNKLGYKVCIEGVENKELINYLNTFNPYSYQGYYYYRPLSKEKFYNELEKDNERRNKKIN